MPGAAPFIVVAVVNLVASYAIGELLAPDSPDGPPPRRIPGVNRDPGVKQRIPTDPANKIPVIYGNGKVAGSITFGDITTDSQTLGMLVTLCEGPIEAFDTILWEDYELTLDADGKVTDARSRLDGTVLEKLIGNVRIITYKNGGFSQAMADFQEDNFQLGERKEIVDGVVEHRSYLTDISAEYSTPGYTRLNSKKESYSSSRLHSWVKGCGIILDVPENQKGSWQTVINDATGEETYEWVTYKTSWGDDITGALLRWDGIDSKFDSTDHNHQMRHPIERYTNDSFEEDDFGNKTIFINAYEYKPGDSVVIIYDWWKYSGGAITEPEESFVYAHLVCTQQHYCPRDIRNQFSSTTGIMDWVKADIGTHWQLVSQGDITYGGHTSPDDKNFYRLINLPPDTLPNIWPNDGKHVMPGLAYAFVEVKYGKEVGLTSIPTNLSFVIRGKKVCALLPISTFPARYEAFKADRDGLGVFSTSPAECLLDYLLDGVYGCGGVLKIDDIDLPSFEVLFNFCNEQVDVDVEGVVTSKARFECNGVVDTSDDRDTIISDFLESCGAYLKYNFGKFSVILKARRISVATIPVSHMHDNFSRRNRGHESKLNKVVAKFQNLQDQLEEDQVVAEIPLEERGHFEPELVEEIPLMFVANEWEAQSIADKHLALRRNPDHIVFTLDASYVELEAGDVVTIDFELAGISEIKYEILSIEESREGEQITKLAIEARAYSEDAVFESVYFYGRPPSDKYRPFRGDIPSEISTFSAAVSDNITLFWSVADQYPGQTIEIWRSKINNRLTADKITEGIADYRQSYIDIGKLLEGYIYYYWCRTVNAYGFFGPWSSGINEGISITAPSTIVITVDGQCISWPEDLDKHKVVNIFKSTGAGQLQPAKYPKVRATVYESSPVNDVTYNAPINYTSPNNVDNCILYCHTHDEPLIDYGLGWRIRDKITGDWITFGYEAKIRDYFKGNMVGNTTFKLPGLVQYPQGAFVLFGSFDGTPSFSRNYVDFGPDHRLEIATRDSKLFVNRQYLMPVKRGPIIIAFNSEGEVLGAYYSDLNNIYSVTVDPIPFDGEFGLRLKFLSVATFALFSDFLFTQTLKEILIWLSQEWADALESKEVSYPREPRDTIEDFTPYFELPSQASWDQESGEWIQLNLSTKDGEPWEYGRDKLKPIGVAVVYQCTTPGGGTLSTTDNISLQMGRFQREREDIRLDIMVGVLNKYQPAGTEQGRVVITALDANLQVLSTIDDTGLVTVGPGHSTLSYPGVVVSINTAYIKTSFTTTSSDLFFEGVVIYFSQIGENILYTSKRPTLSDANMTDADPKVSGNNWWSGWQYDEGTYKKYFRNSFGQDVKVPGYSSSSAEKYTYALISDPTDANANRHYEDWSVNTANTEWNLPASYAVSMASPALAYANEPRPLECFFGKRLLAITEYQSGQHEAAQYAVLSPSADIDLYIRLITLGDSDFSIHLRKVGDTYYQFKYNFKTKTITISKFISGVETELGSAKSKLDGSSPYWHIRVTAKGSSLYMESFGESWSWWDEEGVPAAFAPYSLSVSDGSISQASYVEFKVDCFDTQNSSGEWYPSPTYFDYNSLGINGVEAHYPIKYNHDENFESYSIGNTFSGQSPAWYSGLWTKTSSGQHNKQQIVYEPYTSKKALKVWRDTESPNGVAFPTVWYNPPENQLPRYFWRCADVRARVIVGFDGVANEHLFSVMSCLGYNFYGDNPTRPTSLLEMRMFNDGKMELRSTERARKWGHSQPWVMLTVDSIPEITDVKEGDTLWVRLQYGSNDYRADIVGNNWHKGKIWKEGEAEPDWLFSRYGWDHGDGRELYFSNGGGGYCGVGLKKPDRPIYVTHFNVGTHNRPANSIASNFYDTLFNEFTTGSIPNDWIERWNNQSTTLLTSIGAAGNKQLSISNSEPVDPLNFIGLEIPPDITDLEALAKIMFTSTTQQEEGFKLRLRVSGGPSKDDYHLTFHQRNLDDIYYLTLYKMTGGVSTELHSVNVSTYLGGPGTIDLTSWYWMKFRAVGYNFYGKVWKDGTVEPTFWTLDFFESP